MNPCSQCGHPRSYHTIKHNGCRQCGCPMQRAEIPREETMAETEQIPETVMMTYTDVRMYAIDNTPEAIASFEAGGWHRADADDVSRRKAVEEAVRIELTYRLHTVAAYYRARGKYGETPAADFIEKEIQRSSEKLVRIITEEAKHG